MSLSKFFIELLHFCCFLIHGLGVWMRTANEWPGAGPAPAVHSSRPWAGRSTDIRICLGREVNGHINGHVNGHSHMRMSVTRIYVDLQAQGRKL